MRPFRVCHCPPVRRSSGTGNFRRSELRKFNALICRLLPKVKKSSHLPRLFPATLSFFGLSYLIRDGPATSLFTCCLTFLQALDLLPTSISWSHQSNYTHCNLSILLSSLVARDCPFPCPCDMFEPQSQWVNRSFTRSTDHRSLWLRLPPPQFQTSPLTCDFAIELHHTYKLWCCNRPSPAWRLCLSQLPQSSLLSLPSRRSATSSSLPVVINGTSKVSANPCQLLWSLFIDCPPVARHRLPISLDWSSRRRRPVQTWCKANARIGCQRYSCLPHRPCWWPPGVYERICGFGNLPTCRPGWLSYPDIAGNPCIAWLIPIQLITHD